MGNRPAWRRLAGCYGAALQKTAPLMPTLASALTVIAYVIRQTHWAPLIGSGAALAFWLLLAVLCIKTVTAERANVRTFGDFSDRWRSLQKRLGESQRERQGDAAQPGTPETDNPPPAGPQSDAWQLQEAQVRSRSMEVELGKCDSRWIQGYGYCNLWVALHRAEEALIGHGKMTELAVEEGLRDESRLVGSQIPLAQKLLVRLRNAISTLSPSAAAKYLLDRFDPARESTPPGDGQEENERREKEAFGALRDVRRAINQFNDEQYDALARTRNIYLDIIFVAGLVVFFVLAIAILASVPKDRIEAGAVFYAVGVLAGFAYRWYKEVGAEQTIQDFGLATVRLFRPVVLSGVAAVLAVAALPLIDITELTQTTAGATSTVTATPGTPGATGAAAPTPATPGVTSTATPTPSPSVVGTIAPSPTPTTVPGSRGEEGVPPLRSIFSLEDNILGLLVALVFGASPELLLTLLKAQGEKYTEGLKSTSPGQGSSTA